MKPEPLQTAAETTGGQAYQAATSTELADAYQRIEDLLGETLGEEVDVVTEQTWMWAAAALATLAARLGAQPLVAPRHGLTRFDRVGVASHRSQ